MMKNNYFLNLGFGIFVSIFLLLTTINPLWAGEFSELSQPQQQILGRYTEYWNALTVEKQQRLQKGADKWLSLTPKQRTQAKQRLQKWQKLSPVQQQKALDRFK
ncbi:MAG: DUF3106 domain-containing protein, partial [Thermodesulfobacteriota bacterium]|nr:DUF3106 domain-containing protein [Thermodesulfobacteriota bacterium]